MIKYELYKYKRAYFPSSASKYMFTLIVFGYDIRFRIMKQDGKFYFRCDNLFLFRIKLQNKMYFFYRRLLGKDEYPF